MAFRMNHIWIFVWILVFLIGLKVDCTELLGNKGINTIQNEYYRFFSGLLVHVNWFHLLINIISLYFIVNFLDGQIEPIKLLVFSVVVGTVTCVIFSMIYRECICIGGSPIVFAMLGLMLILQITNKRVERFTLDSFETRWLFGYAILGNIPVFSKNISTFVIHFISFAIALVLGYIGIKLKIL